MGGTVVEVGPVEHTCRPCTWEVERGDSGVQGHPQKHEKAAWFRKGFQWEVNVNHLVRLKQQSGGKGCFCLPSLTGLCLQDGLAFTDI